MLKLLKRIFAFLGATGTSVIFGWWLSQRRQQKELPAPPQPRPLMPPEAPEPKITLPPEAFEDLAPENVEPAVEELPPTSLEEETIEGVIVEAAEVPVDDLTMIKGIGPKFSEALAAIGISHFDELAGADAQDVKNRLGKPVSLPQVKTWIEAARERVNNQ